MRDVLKTEELEIPSGIDIAVKSRLITVTGPRGTLTKNVRHVDMDIRVVKDKTTLVTLAVWQGGRKHVACLRTIRTLINNMVIGVTKVGASIASTLRQCSWYSRVSDTKCVPYTLISLSTASFKRTELSLKSVIFWAKRCVMNWFWSFHLN